MTDASLVSLIRERSRRIRVLPSAIPTTGSLPRRPRAIIFDVYGTLLIRGGDADLGASPHDDELGRVVRDHHLDVGAGELQMLLHKAVLRTHEDARALGISFPEVQIEEIWRRLFPSRHSGEIRQLIVEYELALHPCWPMPGIHRVISSFAKRGIALGIVSNAQFYTPLFLASLLGGRPEDLGFSGDLCFYSWIRGEAKPARGMFDDAGARLRARGIPEGHALMVGNDPVNDVATASRAGFMTAWLAADQRPRACPAGPALPVRPDVTVARLADLLPLVAGPVL